MTFDEFVNKYNGKATDYDGGCGVQCVDLAKLYMDKVCNVKIGAIGNAEAYFRRYDELSVLKNNFIKIKNTARFIPQKGDIAVWGTKLSQYGHIAICDGVGTTSYFYSYDQNWGTKEMKRVEHTYKGFEGVLRPKTKELDIVDTDLYNLIYSDLRGAFHGDSALLKKHYLEHGIKEGRLGSYIFNIGYYLSKNPDVKQAFGNDYNAIYNHYIQYGIREGRQASMVLDPKYYVEQNPDLKQAFGNDYTKIIEHFLIHGINEGRVASKEFNVRKYRDYYKDLDISFKDNWKLYFRHYIIWGKDEGRKCN